MKIIVMSDTHLNYVTAEFKAICTRYCSDADKVVHLGDLVKGPVLDYLEQFPLEAVAGNMDDNIVQDRLPEKKVFGLGGRRFGIIHGWGPGTSLKSRLSQEFPDVDAILYGHSHQPFLVQENGLFWFNPGSVFSGRGGYPPSLGILYLEDQIRGEIIPL